MSAAIEPGDRSPVFAVYRVVRRWFLAAAGVALVAGGCTKADESTPAVEGQTNEQQQPAKSSAPGTCETDLDCEPCGGEPGCRRASASCWQGQCVQRHEAAGPCRSDDECEVRADPCRCDLYPALASARPPEEGCIGRSCGGSPNPQQFAATCDSNAHRCVLERRFDVPNFELSLACSMHGVRISTHRIEVSSAPPFVRSEETDAPARERKLDPQMLGPLWGVLSSPGFAAFVDETPKDGTPHPGMKKCTLDVASPSLKVEGKSWMSDDEFSAAAAEARRAMHAELGKLREFLSGPVKLDIDLDALELPRDVKRDWLKKDLELIPRFANVFPPQSLHAVVTALENDGDDCKPREQGFGVEVRTCAIGAGYSKCHATLVSHDKRLFEVSAACRTSERSWDKVKPAIERAHELALVPSGFERKGNVSTFEMRDASVLAAARADVASELRPQSGADVPPKLEEPFELLTSPRAKLVVGTYCGGAGAPPPGHRAMKQLVEAGREDLLRDALHGMNAGGRLYGYVGLKLLKKNTKADDAIFDIVTHQDLEIETCGGCDIDHQKAADIDLTGFRRRH